MSDNLTQAIALVFGSEGGFVNHPKDPGGATKYGITAATLGAWRRLGRKATPQEVKNLSLTEAANILDKQYAQPLHYRDLPAGLDYALFDYSTNSGPSQAVKTLQRVLGVDADGVMGVKTLNAIRMRDTSDLIDDLQTARLKFLKGLKTWKTFGRGWGTRVEHVRETALKMARGIQPKRIEPPTVDLVKGKEYAEVTTGSALANPADTKLSATTAGKGAIATAVGVISGSLSEAKGSLEPLIGSNHFVDSIFTLIVTGGSVLAVAGVGMVLYSQVKNRAALA